MEEQNKNKQEKPKTIIKYVKETSTNDSVNKKFDCYDGTQLEMNICSFIKLPKKGYSGVNFLQNDKAYCR